MEDPHEEIVPAYEFEQPKPKRKYANERKHLRLEGKGMKACIRVTGQEEDIVDVLDYSRGGLRFSSFKPYEPDQRIEVATNYSPSAINIFQQARVVGMYQRPWGNFAGEYGAQFVK